MLNASQELVCLPSIHAETGTASCDQHFLHHDINKNITASFKQGRRSTGNESPDPRLTPRNWGSPSQARRSLAVNHLHSFELSSLLRPKPVRPAGTSAGHVGCTEIRCTDCRLLVRNFIATGLLAMDLPCRDSWSLCAHESQDLASLSCFSPGDGANSADGGDLLLFLALQLHENIELTLNDADRSNGNANAW